MSRPGTPSALPEQASAESLPAMNEAAASSSNAQGGVLPCKKKAWFAILLSKVDEKNHESYLPGVTVQLNVPGLGKVERVSANSARAIRFDQLEPGGTGDVLAMRHDSAVYEALGDFS